MQQVSCSTDTVCSSNQLYILTAPGDYTTTSVPLTFTSQNSDQMLCVDIPINDDLLCEGLENFFANLVTNDPDVNIVSPPLSLNIIDNDGKDTP